MRRGWILLLPLLIGACAAPRSPESTLDGGQPEGFPAALYAGSPARGQAIYRVDSQASEIIIRVGRTGSLARLGHDHALAARNIRGGVLIDADPARSRADLYFALADLELDTPSLRTRAGLEGQLTADEIAGTREHMLKDELDAQRMPWVLLSATWATGTKPASVLHARLTLHGVTREMRIPVTLTQAAGRIQATGKFRIQQSAFGIKPYSVFGGALAVDDWLDLSFSIQASNAAPGGDA